MDAEFLGAWAERFPEVQISIFFIAHVAPCGEVVGAVGALYPIGKVAHKTAYRANLEKAGWCPALAEILLILYPFENMTLL